MKKQLFAALVAMLVAMPLLAQRRVDLIVDVEGVRRTSEPREFTPNQTRFSPRFAAGGGVGAGINWFFSDRVSLEAKAAALESHVRVRINGSDYVAIADLGNSQIYPITAVLQWHMNEHGAIRPYVGAGGAYTILRDIDKSGAGFSGIHFKDPFGVVLAAGLEWRLSSKWGLNGDLRYIPLESNARTVFIGSQSSVNLNSRPVIGSAGVVYHF